MKEVDETFEDDVMQKNENQPENTEASIGIRPRPLICKPGHVNVGCKSEPLETKWHWAPGAWQDATRTSAFQPYKVRLYSYVINLRGLIIYSTYSLSDFNVQFFCF